MLIGMRSDSFRRRRALLLGLPEGATDGDDIRTS
ncbi:Uncharacterised protein [Stutzerimonas stutzeri]|nr:Uncharacterised protein [Stutzerimonas stutzeri]